MTFLRHATTRHWALPTNGRQCRTLLLALLFLLTGACDKAQESYQPSYSAEPAEPPGWFVFGVHPLHNPDRLHELYGPLADLLSARIPGSHFRLEASRNYAAYDEKLYAGRFHFALPNPYQTVLAGRHGYRVFGKVSNDDDFRGIILVRKDGKIRHVSDLKGQAMSFPAPTALAATMLPQYFLQQHGLDVQTDLDIRYVGSQESSIMNVFLGDVAAAATWPPPWRALSQQRPELRETLEIRWQTSSLPNISLMARHDVPAGIVSQVGQILFALHEDEQGRALLKGMELSGFEPADEHNYQPVQDFLARFNEHVRPIEH